MTQASDQVLQNSLSAGTAGNLGWRTSGGLGNSPAWCATCLARTTTAVGAGLA